MSQFTFKQVKILFKFKSFQKTNFKFIISKILQKIHSMSLKTSGFFTVPIKFSRYTVLRSPHVDKKSREQFEKRIYSKNLIIYFNLYSAFEKQQILLLLKFLENSLSGVDLKINYYI